MSKPNWQNIWKESEARRKYTVFFLCLLFSLIAWLSIKLSRENVASFQVSVTIVNIPENLKFVAPSDSVIFVNLHTTGFKLLASHLFGCQRALEVDYNMLQRRGHATYKQYFLTASQAEISYGILNNLSGSILHIQPDTIFFTVFEVFRNNVPVLPDTQLQFDPDFNKYNDPPCRPGSGIVKGRVRFRDAVNYNFTEIISRQGILHDILILIKTSTGKGLILEKPQLA